MSEGNKLRLTFLLYFFYFFIYFIYIFFLFLFFFLILPLFLFPIFFLFRFFHASIFFFFIFFLSHFHVMSRKKERSDELRCHSSLTYHFRNTMRSGVDGWMGDSVSWLVGWVGLIGWLVGYSSFWLVPSLV